MASITAGGHTFKQLRVDRERLEAELARRSKENGATRFFLKKEHGCVLTEISMGDLEPPDPDVADDSYVLIIDEQVH